MICSNLSSIYKLENRGWELVAEAELEADELAEGLKDAIYFSSPQSKTSYKKAQQVPPPK
jgi:hypothetical protein